MGSINRKMEGVRRSWFEGSGDGKVSVRWLVGSTIIKELKCCPGTHLRVMCILSRQNSLGTSRFGRREMKRSW